MSDQISSPDNSRRDYETPTANPSTNLLSLLSVEKVKYRIFHDEISSSCTTTTPNEEWSISNIFNNFSKTQVSLTRLLNISTSYHKYKCSKEQYLCQTICQTNSYAMLYKEHHHVKGSMYNAAILHFLEIIKDNTKHTCTKYVCFLIIMNISFS